MKVIKNINNNISLCLDSRNNEVVAFGKGIGFTKPPYDVPLSKIDRTFYDVDEEQLAVLKRIPEDVLEAAAEIVDLANEKMDNQFRENVVFTLADHIDFPFSATARTSTSSCRCFTRCGSSTPENLSWASRRWIS